MADVPWSVPGDPLHETHRLLHVAVALERADEARFFFKVLEAAARGDAPRLSALFHGREATHPTAVEVSSSQAESLFWVARDYAGAIRAADAALALVRPGPHGGDAALYLKGRALVELGHYPEALEALRLIRDHDYGLSLLERLIDAGADIMACWQDLMMRIEALRDRYDWLGRWGMDDPRTLERAEGLLARLYAPGEA